MASTGLEVVAFTVAILGWILELVACGLPTWRVTAYLGKSIIVAQSTWEGLWMQCVWQATGYVQCKVHDSMLALSGQLQAARAMTVLSAVIGVLAMSVTAVGLRCTTCADVGRRGKARIVQAGGVMLLMASVLILIPVSWTAHHVVRDFHDPGVQTKQDLGGALFVGWAAAVLLAIGGALLVCCSCPPSSGPQGRPPYTMQPLASCPQGAAPYRAPPLSGTNGKSGQPVREFV